MPYKPKMIVFYAGDNDLNDKKTPEQVFADYKQFVEKVRAKLPKVRIAFISIKPSPSRAALLDKMIAANKLIKDYSTKKKNLRYIDVFNRMIGKDGKPRPELFVDDNLHMNAAGYALWTKIVGPYVR
jgi:lysophospholipase L1-like esterase